MLNFKNNFCDMSRIFREMQLLQNSRTLSVTCDGFLRDAMLKFKNSLFDM